MAKKILLSLTTTGSSKHFNWREKIKEIEKFNIEEIALYPTAIDREEREELYGLLEKTPLKSIHHVHLRNDMMTKEIDYLVGRYGVKVFNIHPSKSSYPFDNFPKKYSANIYIENVEVVPEKEELDKCGGICIDFSHWDKAPSKFRKGYKNFTKLLDQYKIGCCHISGVKYYFGIYPVSRHFIKSKKELDYIKKYRKYFPDIMSFELENSFQEQMEFKKYLEKIIL